MTGTEYVAHARNDQPRTLIIRERPAAEALGVSVAALRRWRREGRGPAFVRIERCIGYRLTDLESFLAARVVAPQAAGTTNRSLPEPPGTRGNSRR